jgi:hypothetical protein
VTPLKLAVAASGYLGKRYLVALHCTSFWKSEIQKSKISMEKEKLHDLSPLRANYTDQATAACRQS